LDDRLRPCKHISLELPSPIFVVELSTRVESNQTVIQHIFLVVNSFLELDFIIAMIHILTCQICIFCSVVRALRFVSERLPVLVQSVCFCSSGKGSPKLFKSSETKPSLSQSHHSIDCLREAKSFLQNECANESSFTEDGTTIQNKSAGSIEMRLQNGLG
jgi:hypothetical protein